MGKLNPADYSLGHATNDEIPFSGTGIAWLYWALAHAPSPF